MVGVEDGDGVADSLQLANLVADETKARQDFELQMKDMNEKSALSSRKMDIEEEKLKVTRENMVNDIQVAKENAKNRAKKASK